MPQLTPSSRQITTFINNVETYYDHHVLRLLRISIQLWCAILPEYFPQIFPPGHNFSLHRSWHFFGGFDEWCNSRDRYASITISMPASVTFSMLIWPPTVEEKLADKGEYAKALDLLRQLGDDLVKLGQDIRYVGFAWGSNVRFLRYYRPGEGFNTSKEGILRHANVLEVADHNDEPVTYNLRIDDHRKCVARFLGFVRAGILLADFIE